MPRTLNWEKKAGEKEQSCSSCFKSAKYTCLQGHPTNLFLTLSVPHRNLAGWQNIRCSNELAGKFLIVRGFGWELLTFLAFQAELAEKLWRPRTTEKKYPFPPPESSDKHLTAGQRDRVCGKKPVFCLREWWKVKVSGGWKAGSSVAYCEPCFREVMEEQEKIECNDSNEFGKNRDLQKQEEWCSTRWKSMMAWKYGTEPRPFSFSIREIKVRIDTQYAIWMNELPRQRRSKVGPNSIRFCT